MEVGAGMTSFRHTSTGPFQGLYSKGHPGKNKVLFRVTVKEFT